MKKMPAELNSVLSDLSVLYFGAISCHGPVSNHSQIRIKFADYQQIHGLTVGQGMTR